MSTPADSPSAYPGRPVARFIPTPKLRLLDPCRESMWLEQFSPRGWAGFKPAGSTLHTGCRALTMIGITLTAFCMALPAISRQLVMAYRALTTAYRVLTTAYRALTTGYLALTTAYFGCCSRFAG